MPWKECSAMEERPRFVARLLEGEGMSQVCREFGISRKTGDKIFNRCKKEGLEAPCDHSRRPVSRNCQAETGDLRSGLRSNLSLRAVPTDHFITWRFVRPRR